MNSFKSFNIKPKINSFVGDKISVKKVLNQEITVLDFKVEPSTKKPGTEYLTLQIERDGDKRVVFSGSKILADQIKQVRKDQFPFKTTIKGDNEYFEFT